MMYSQPCIVHGKLYTQAHSQVQYGLIREYDYHHDYYYQYYDECVRLWVAQDFIEHLLLEKRIESNKINHHCN